MNHHESILEFGFSKKKIGIRFKYMNGKLCILSVENSLSTDTSSSLLNKSQSQHITMSAKNVIFNSQATNNIEIEEEDILKKISPFLFTYRKNVPGNGVSKVDNNRLVVCITFIHIRFLFI
jgi:hypothetical protein